MTEIKTFADAEVLRIIRILVSSRERVQRTSYETYAKNSGSRRGCYESGRTDGAAYQFNVKSMTKTSAH